MTVHAQLGNRAIFAACLISAAGGLVFNAFPLFLSAIARQHGFDDEQLGLLGTYYLGAAALVSLLAPLWMPRLHWRATALAGYVCIGIAILWLGQVGSDWVHWCMALLGVGSIALFTIALGILSAATDPNRAYGLKLTAEMLVAGILMWVMTGVIIEQFGYQGFIWGTLVVYGATALVVWSLPRNFLNDIELRRDSAAAPGMNIPAILACIALFLQFGVLAGLWGFMERIGSEAGINNATIGTILTLSLLAGLCGALIAAAIGERCGHLIPIVSAMSLAIVANCMLMLASGSLVFAIVANLINTLVQFLLVFQMGLITETDISGRYTVIIAFVLCLGGAVGPGVLGAAIEADGFNSAYKVAIMATLIAMLMTVAAVRLAATWSILQVTK